MRFLLATAVTALCALTPARVLADNMDPALARFIVDDQCRAGSAAQGVGAFYDPVAGFDRCVVNNMHFAKLIGQLGFAVAPTASHAARTTGFGGFKVALESSFTTIDSDAEYWKLGTQGPKDNSTDFFSRSNQSPDSVLQMYALKLAKGFPFGLELGANFGFLANTAIVAGGGDVRIALFEGFRESVPGFIPDVGVGGGVRTITGTPEFKLTVAAFDVQISKPIPVAGTVVITPHIGYQWIRIFGDSGLVDLTPNTDPLTSCGYLGDNTPATPDPNKAGLDGQPVCTGSSGDFNNNIVFDPVRLTRHRINFGGQLRYQMVHFGLHVITDVASPVTSNKQDEPYQAPNPDAPASPFLLDSAFVDDPRTAEEDELASQWTIALELGALF